MNERKGRPTDGLKNVNRSQGVKYDEETGIVRKRKQLGRFRDFEHDKVSRMYLLIGRVASVQLLLFERLFQ